MKFQDEKVTDSVPSYYECTSDTYVMDMLIAQL